MVDCEKASELITECIDGSISDADREILALHLESCPECAEYFEILSEVSGSLGPDEEPPEELVTGVMAKVSASGRAEKKTRGQRILTRAMSFAACIIVVTAVGYFVSRTGLFGGSSDASSADMEIMTTTTAETQDGEYTDDDARSYYEEYGEENETEEEETGSFDYAYEYFSTNYGRVLYTDTLSGLIEESGAIDSEYGIYYEISDSELEEVLEELSSLGAWYNVIEYIEGGDGVVAVIVE